MKHLLNIFLLIFIFSQHGFAAGVKTLQGDIWKSNDLTKTWTPPAASAPLVGTTSTQTLTNKTLTSPVINTPTGIVKGDVGLGNVDNTSDATKNSATATLTNKDIDGGTASNTSRITIPKNSKTNLDALTRKQGTIVYDTTSNKPYYDDGAALKVIGSGSGGGINLIADGDAEGSNPFTAYKDSATALPVDGTGGTTSFVSVAISGTTPLSGINSFVITKSFGNPIGEGVSVPFTIQPAYKARMLKISFDYFASTAFEPPYSTFNSDIIVYIYDVTSGKLIEPSNIQIRSRDTNGTFQAEFQSDSASTDYRLILHCGTVNTAAWTFKADNFSISPSQYIYGSVDTEWIAYTPTVVGLGTVTLSETFWRRVGDSIQIRGRLTSGTPTATTVTISLPNNYVISSSKNTIQSVYGHLVNNSLPGNFDLLATGGGTTVGVGNVGGSSGLSAAIGTTVSGNTQAIAWYSQPIPIQGWGSNTQVSDGYEAREVSFRHAYGSVTGLNNNNSSVRVNIPGTPTHDSVAGWSASDFGYKIKNAGIYDFSADISVNITNTIGSTYMQAQIYKNGSEIGRGILVYLVGSLYQGLSATALSVPCVVGDVIDVRLYSTGNNSSSTLTVNGGYFNGNKHQSPATTSALATNILRYTGTAAATLTSSTQTYKWNTKDYDDFNLYDTSTGITTIKESGRYRIKAKIAAVAPAATISYGVRINVNGSQKTLRGESITASYSFPMEIDDIYDLKAGDTISVSYEISSGTGTISTSAAENVLNISRVK